MNVDISRATESQFDSGVWSESVASSEPLTEETEKAEQLLTKLDNIGLSLNTAVTISPHTTQWSSSSSSCAAADPEDLQIRELLLSKLAKYRGTHRV